VPVITIDGPRPRARARWPAGLAQRLGWHFLDSGAVYRATALAAQRSGVAPTTRPALARMAAALDLRFDGEAHLAAGERRGRRAAPRRHRRMASRVSAWPAVREALVQLQLAFRRAPGLVADGRDMGTVIFPDAPLKVFLTASAAERAERRHKQLISKGIPASIADLRADIEARDARDQSRAWPRR
jgi:3-phosphoshikimate 1-carboxyvinyltransferase